MHPFGFTERSFWRLYQYFEKFLIAFESCSSISLPILLLFVSFLIASAIIDSPSTLCKFSK